MKKVSKAYPSNFSSNYALETTRDFEGHKGKRKIHPFSKSSNFGFGVSRRIKDGKLSSYGAGYGDFSRNEVEATATASED